MVEDYPATIGERVDHEFEIKRSRFICHLQPVASVADADAFIAAIRKEFWDARHNCVAHLHHYPVHSQVLSVERFIDPADGVHGKSKIRAVLKYGVTNQVAGIYVFEDPAAAIAFLSDTNNIVSASAHSARVQRIVSDEEVEAWRARHRVHREAARILRIPDGASSAEAISGLVGEAELKRISRDLQVAVFAAEIRNAHPNARTATVHKTEDRIVITRISDMHGHPITSKLVGTPVLNEWTFAQLRRTFEPSTDGSGVQVPLLLHDVRPAH